MKLQHCYIEKEKTGDFEESSNKKNPLTINVGFKSFLIVNGWSYKIL